MNASFEIICFITQLMKANFLSLIHQTAAEKKRVQSLRQETDKSRGEQVPRSRESVVGEIIDSRSSDDLPEIPQQSFDPQMQIVLEQRLPLAPAEQQTNESYQRKYLNDIDRKLAVFYHPLFIEITEEWLKLLLGPGDRQERISFVSFVELNLRLQKCLLAKFDLSSAFVSALKDWVKEVGDCFQMRSLYLSNEDNVIARDQMIGLPFQPAINEDDYQRFFDQQKNQDIYKFLGIKISIEVCGKFLFDLCVSWCQHLDIELFSYFLLGLLLQISHGSTMDEAQLVRLQDARLLPVAFLEDFQEQVQLYGRYKRKNLAYYRAWCEWNYLRMEEIGESVLAKLLDMFPNDDRAESVVRVFSKAIDVVNKEITQQVKQTPAKVATTLVQESLIPEPESPKWEHKIQRSQQQHQEQYLSQDYYLDRIAPLVPDQFVITYNEYEKAFILERKVAMPIIGQKMSIKNLTGQQRYGQHQRSIIDKKDAYVYYISNEMSQEAKNELIKNLHKPKPLPHLNGKNRQQSINQIEIRMQQKRASPSKPQDLNNTFSHPPSTSQQHSMAPNFLNENETFLIQEPLRSRYASGDQGYNPVYNTSKKTWEDFSHSIENQRRLLKNDIPKDVIQTKFKPKEFNKLVARKDYPTYLGKINTPAQQAVNQGRLKQPLTSNNSPLENIHIAQVIQNREESVEMITDYQERHDSSKDMEQKVSSGPRQQFPMNGGYSLHNVTLTFDQWESLQHNRHLWESVLTWDEVKALRQDDNKFYHILQLLKLKFNQEHKSDYLRQLRLEFNYASRRDEMGGAISIIDRERFHSRIEKLIQRDKKRKERRRKRRKAKVQTQQTKAGQIYKAKPKDYEIKTPFKNANSRNIFKEIFVKPVE